MLVGEDCFRVAAYDVFGSSGGGVASSWKDIGCRTGGLTHDESLFLLLNGETMEEISVLSESCPTAPP